MAKKKHKRSSSQRYAARAGQIRENTKIRVQQVAENMANGIASPWSVDYSDSGISYGKRVPKRSDGIHQTWASDATKYTTVYNDNSSIMRRMKNMSRGDLEYMAKVVASDWNNTRQAIVRDLGETQVRQQANPYRVTQRVEQLANQDYPQAPRKHASGKELKLYNQRINRIFEARQTVEQHDKWNEDHKGERAQSALEVELAAHKQGFGRDKPAPRTTGTPSIEKQFVNGTASILEHPKNLNDRQLREYIMSRMRNIKRYESTKTKRGRKLTKSNNKYIENNLRASYGDDVAKMWDKLTQEQRYNLSRSTHIVAVSKYYSMYDEYTLKFVSWRDGADNKQYESNRDYVKTMIGQELAKNKRKNSSKTRKRNRRKK